MMLADVSFTTQGSAIVAALRGEVDLSNSREIRYSIFQSVTRGSTTVVLDLSDVEYLDSAGIQLIYRLREDLRARGQALAVVAPGTSPVNDALLLAGVTAQVDATESVEQALERVAEESGRRPPNDA